MLINLITSDYFDEAGHHHLPVGHTHEDIDGVFGLLSNILQTCGDSLQTPADMARLFDSKVGPVLQERNEFPGGVRKEKCMQLRCGQVFLRVGYLHSLCKDEAVMQSAEMGPMGSIDYVP